MRVDEMSGETLEYWSDVAAKKLAEGRKPPRSDSRIYWVDFQDDAPDPLNNDADTMAVIKGLRVNLTCAYDSYSGLISRHEPWTAECGWPGLRGISIRGSTQEEAVTRLFVACLVGREIET